MKRLTALTIILTMVTSLPVQAQSDGRRMSDDQYYSRISEYFYSPTGKEVLIPVQVLGQVARPGLYHIPPETSLTTLLAISGGTNDNANTGKIRLFRDNKMQKLDLDDVLEEQPNFGLKHKDTLYIPEKPKLINDNTMTTILAISAIASTILTIHWIRNERER